MKAATEQVIALWLAAVASACSAEPVASHPDAAGSAEGSVEPVIELDVPYSTPEGGDPNLSVMDIYYIPDGQPKRLLLFVHGGSWVGGDKGNLALAADFVPWFLERDFVVAAANFRLASAPSEGDEVTYSDQSTDIAHALARLRDHDTDYGITEAGAVLLGYSSGAHLVALLAADERYLLAAGQSHADLAAVISFDVHAYDVPYALQLMAGSDLEVNIPLIEHLFGETAEEQRLGSPSLYAGEANVAPTLLVSAEPSAREGSHGYIAAHASEAYATLLDSAGHEASWVHYDEETHSSLMLDFGVDGDGPTAAVAAFLE